LPPGYHTITIRAWNVFNQYSEATVGFIIPTERQEGILGASFTPNPAGYNEQIGLAIYYSVTPSIEAEIRVFDMNGKEMVNTTAILNADGYTIID